jgi:predicted esterase
MRYKIRVVLATAVMLLTSARGEKPLPFIFTPTEGGGPFPVAVWLHGYRGYSTSGYFPGETSAAMQKHADKLGAVIIGFPATTDLGDGTQQWSEEPVADYAYIQATLRAMAKTNKLDLSRVGLFGFSQGAMVAADLATLYPESYCGAILMSPGGMGSPKAAKLRLPAHAKQVYYCFCGAEEHPGNVGLTKAYAKRLETVLGAHVTLKLYEGVSKHTRPADFMEKFPEWMGEILKKHE